MDKELLARIKYLVEHMVEFLPIEGSPKIARIKAVRYLGHMFPEGYSVDIHGMLYLAEAKEFVENYWPELFSQGEPLTLADIRTREQGGSFPA